MKKVAVIGPFPPPVHGMAKNLKIFYDQLNAIDQAFKIDTSPGTIVRGYKYHTRKIYKVIIGFLRFFILCFCNKVKSVYLPPDAGFGSWYSLGFVLIAKIFAVKIVFHHRSFLYINKKTTAMSLIVKSQPKNTTHVFLCDKMKIKFNEIYQNTSDCLIVSNAQYVQPVRSIKKVGQDIIIGHLSNLGFEKGLQEVFMVVEQLIELGIDVKLELAGPPENDEVATYINNKVTKLGERLIYHGPVYDDKKSNFYKSIDFFLFPTTYRNEAQPNVLFESMAYGVPVFSINTGCISSDVNCSTGFVSESPSNFVCEAVDILKTLSASTLKIEELKRSTIQNITVKSADAKHNYNLLFKLVSEQ